MKQRTSPNLFEGIGETVLHWLQELSQEAIELGFEGLMIETHARPEKVLSDSKQQIISQELKTLLGNLCFYSINSKDKGTLPQHEVSLKALRNLIESFDQELLEGLQKRMKVVKQIALFKKGWENL